MLLIFSLILALNSSQIQNWALIQWQSVKYDGDFRKDRDYVAYLDANIHVTAYCMLVFTGVLGVANLAGFLYR